LNLKALFQLAKGEEFYISLLNQLNYPILIFEPDGLVVFANSKAKEILELSGEVLPDYLNVLLDISERLDLYRYGHEVTLMPPGGKPETFLLKPLYPENPGCLILATGLSKEFEVIPSRFGESYGESLALAGELSQRVKGPLAGIELFASIVGEELADSADLSFMIHEIRSSVREMNEYLTSVESMTRPLEIHPEPTNLTGVLDEVLGALKELFKSKKIGVLVEMQDVTVLIDRSLMAQTFFNILINAVEAMPLGGRLIVKVEPDSLGEVRVIFTDSGPGVKFQDYKKIFNPFFTTKPKALGLGLPVSQRIVEAHQGNLIFGMDEFLGARVKVVLPYIPGDDVLEGSLN
ncbi:MAG: hypothetical protein LBF22_05900, partial [Deltaproteobacteria bacterium]|nr:hypothetical protein [Deltaproteobacteria bacterium]